VRCLLLGGGGPVGTAALYAMKRLGRSAWVVDPQRPFHQEYHARNLQGTVDILEQVKEKREKNRRNKVVRVVRLKVK